MPSARVVVEGNTNIVRVHVSPETLYDLEATQQLTQLVLSRVGCPHCCSGRFILFQQEEGEFGVE
jgi:hypothetical protein